MKLAELDEQDVYTFGGRLDLNRASAKELEMLPGIGEKRALAIIETRARLGGFEALEDLLDVPGIGPSTLSRLDRLCRVVPQSDSAPSGASGSKR